MIVWWRGRRSVWWNLGVEAVKPSVFAEELPTEAYPAGTFSSTTVAIT